MTVFHDICYVSMALAMLYYKNIEEPPTLFYAVAMTFFIGDMVLLTRTTDFIIHHVLTTYLFAHKYTYGLTSDVQNALLGTEVSGIALAIVPYLPTFIKPVGEVAFVAIYFQNRIIGMYKILTLEHSASNIAIWGLYTLNLYWFAIICRKASRPLLKGKDLYKLNHLFCTFTFTGIAWFESARQGVYNGTIQWLLAVSSLKVHWNAFREQDDVRWCYADLIFMHASFFCSNFYLPLLHRAVSLILHAPVLYYRIKNVDRMADTLDLSMIPMVYDGGMPLFEDISQETKKGMLVCAICILLLRKIKPLYDLSFCGLHLMLLWFIHLRTDAHVQLSMTSSLIGKSVDFIGAA
jgi:hypothetical protein